jgi:hypothetical protein
MASLLQDHILTSIRTAISSNSCTLVDYALLHGVSIAEHLKSSFLVLEVVPTGPSKLLLAVTEHAFIAHTDIKEIV